MPSLAEQLAARNSLVSSKLSTNKHSFPSFIFTAKYARSVSNADLHALAVNAWDQLSAVDPRNFNDKLFTAILGEQAKRVDRTLLTPEENEALSLVLEKVMRSLAYHVALRPSGVIVEWLIRRFSIHTMNIPQLVALYLPYHTTPQFPSALHVIPEKELGASDFNLLLPAKKYAQPVPLSAIVDLMAPFSGASTAHFFLQFILKLPAAYLNHHEPVPQPLVAFYLQVVSAYLERAKSSLPNGERISVLTSLLEIIKTSDSQLEIILAAYVLLSRFAVHYPFSSKNILTVLKNLFVHRVVSGDENNTTADMALLTTAIVVTELISGEIEYAPTSETAFIDEHAFHSLLAVSNLPAILTHLSLKYKGAKFMGPFLTSLVASGENNDSALQLTQEFISIDGSPDFIVTIILNTLFSLLLASTSPKQEFITILGDIYQRHPQIWETVTKQQLSDSSEERRPILWKILNAVVNGESVFVDDTSSELFVSSMSADATVRLMSLQALIAEAPTLLESNPIFVRKVLVERLAETDAAILKALLDASLLHSVVPPEEIVSLLSNNIATGALDSAAYATVTGYLFNSFIDAFDDENHTYSELVLRTVAWNGLLLTKKSVKASTKMYAQLASSTLVQRHPWLKNLPALPDNLDAEKSSQYNEALVAAIAKNISKSATARFVETWLLPEIDADSPTFLTLAVGSKLLDSKKVSSEALASIVAKLADMPLENTHDSASQDSVVLSLYSKAHHATKTLARLRVSLVAACLTALKSDAAWVWLTPLSSAHSVIYAVYALLIHLQTPKLKELFFVHVLPVDSLCFLSSIWSSPAQTESFKMNALADAVQIIQALSSYDFQAIVPSLLVALLDAPTKDMREAVLNILSILSEGKPSSKNIYGGNAYYGGSEFQYLSSSDEVKYLKTLLAKRLELSMDGQYLLSVHRELKAEKLDKVVTTYLVSHVTAWPSLHGAGTLLRSMSLVRNDIKTQGILSILQTLVKADAAPIDIGAGLDDAEAKLYATGLLQIYGGSSRKWMESEDVYFSTLFDIVKLKDTSGLKSVLRATLLDLLVAHTYKVIRGDKRFQLLSYMLTQCAFSEDSVLAAQFTACVTQCRHDSESVARVLSDINARLLREAGGHGSGSKRARGSSGISTAAGSPASASGRPNTPTPLRQIERQLTSTLDLIDFSRVDVSSDLLLVLFDLLSNLVTVAGSFDLEIQYLGQTILSDLSQLVDKITPQSDINPDSIRIASVLELMRSTVSPQISQQTLLLLAQLAPIVPDQLVSSVMPIFLFMGANMLTRDDAYSLRVVERTLESIVPAMLKGRGTVDLRGVIKTFTDAAPLLRLHKGVNLFVKLVQTLSDRDSLARVCILLLNRSDRASECDVGELSLAVFEHFSFSVQLHSVLQIAKEVETLLRKTDQPFSYAADEWASLVAPKKQRAKGPKLSAADVHAQTEYLLAFLVTLVQTKQFRTKMVAVSGSESSVVLSIAKLLVVLLPLCEDDTKEIVHECLNSFTEIMPGATLNSLCLSLVGSSRAEVCDILIHRLETTKVPEKRDEIVPSCVRVIETSDIGSSRDLAVMSAIAASRIEDEQAALGQKMGPLLDAAVVAGPMQETALKVAVELAHSLGTRLIPFMARCVTVAKELVKHEGALAPLSLNLLHGITTSVPTFISAQVQNLLRVIISGNPEDEALVAARHQLVSALTKRIDSGALFSGIGQVFSYDLDADQLSVLLDTLNRALRHSAAAAVAKHYRVLFKLFLTVFDYRRLKSDGAVNTVESRVLGPFTQYVLKLNEQIFRPVFLRLVDWAVIDAEASDNKRKIVLFRVVSHLLEQLRTIVVPYYSFVLDECTSVIAQNSSGELYTNVLVSLAKSLEYDEGGFWGVSRLSKLVEPVSQHINSSPEFYTLIEVLGEKLALHEDLLRSFNNNVLMLTRSEEHKIKSSALHVLYILWSTIGDTMMDYAQQTALFVLEAVDDTHDETRREALALTKVVENHLGETIESYLA